MPIINDKEFGPITVRRSALATSVRIRVSPAGELRISAPPYTPLLLIRRFVNSSRSKLRPLLVSHHQQMVFKSDMAIGKSHHLSVAPVRVSTTSVKRTGQQIIVRLAENENMADSSVQSLIRGEVITALRREAKSYLPKRLAYLAKQYDYQFTRVRFSHASSRWGSCSTKGTISLNIALMKLPFELIDYVLLHELAHTQQMNHSQEFWSTLSQTNPDYKLHRRALKQESPSI